MLNTIISFSHLLVLELGHDYFDCVLLLPPLLFPLLVPLLSVPTGALAASTAAPTVGTTAVCSR